MAVYYLDSSAMVKRYAQETGSGWVSGLLEPQAGHEIFIALVAGAEIIAAISRRVRMGTLSAQDGQTAITAFKSSFRAEYRIVATTTNVVDSAMDLAEQHGLRGYDAIQLASALIVEAELTRDGVGPLTFVSADINLNTAASTMGLIVDNPNNYP